MDGVTILNSYLRLSENNAGILFLISIASVLGFLGGVSCLCDGGVKGYIWGTLICGGCLAFFVMWCIIMPRTEYIQATVDDTVSWVELTDKYEIIKSEGRIITMIEKEQKDDER